jgi:3-methyl-2-oxobutanoate hydroxymethyltransferase
MDKVTLQTFQERKVRGEPIVMLTAYDYPTGLLLDQSGVDAILVGDSLGMVVHGFDSTLPVTMEMMVLHCRAVRRGVQRAFVIGDMPFMSFQTTVEDAKRNAARLLIEGGADAVKLEGGRHMAETVRALVEIGIAVQGHIGLTPQSLSALGGFNVQGKTVETARRLIDDAHALEDAGVFSIVLEAVPGRLGEHITRSLRVPTIGVGAGVGCDGQILVTHDLIGLFDRFTPKFVKRYATVAETLRTAFESYCDDVRAHAFPAEEHTYDLPEDVWRAILADDADKE